MGKSRIEWTEKVWNPVRGCTRVSEGCRNCYAERQAVRQIGGLYAGTVKSTPSGPRWTGSVICDESKLSEPGSWRQPCRVFVNSMSDLFHEGVPEVFIARVFITMAKLPQHTFQILTKRPARALQILNHISPLPNVWLGVSVEDQATADERITLLRRTPAIVRWVSYEPALGRVDWERGGFSLLRPMKSPSGTQWPGLNWVVCGGESGPGARPMHPDWARSARDECVLAAVPFFFKQWGEWAPASLGAVGLIGGRREEQWVTPAGTVPGRGHELHRWSGTVASIRIGKKAAGHLLDGIEHRQYPVLVPPQHACDHEPA